MNKILLLSLIVAIAFCQTHTDAVCAGTEVADGTHQQLYIGAGEKCILKGAIDNFVTFSEAVEANGVVSGSVVDLTFELTFALTDPNNCGAGSEACFDTEFYSVSLTNKNDQDAAEASGTLLSSKVVLDATKIDDTNNWCNAPDPATGVIECTITATYGFKGITGGEIHTIPVTVEITKNTDIITAVAGDAITVTVKDQGNQAGIEGSCFVQREATLTRHENDSFDQTVLTNPQKGDNIFLQIALDHASDQAIGPFRTTNYQVFLITSGGQEINITSNVVNAQTVDIGLEGTNNHVFRLTVPMNYIGTYNIKVEAVQPTPVVSGRILEEVGTAPVKNVAKSFLSVTVLPEK